MEVTTITVCPRRSDPFYIVSYYIKCVTTSWTYSTRKRYRLDTARDSEKDRERQGQRQSGTLRKTEAGTVTDTGTVTEKDCILFVKKNKLKHG